MTEFVCGECGSSAVVYPKDFDDDAPVICARCSTFISNYRDFKSRAEAVIGGNSEGGRSTGC